MADYLAECVFQLEDKASNPLKKFIGNVETAHKALTDFNALLGTTSKFFDDLKIAGAPVAVMFADLRKEIGGLSTAFGRANTTKHAFEQNLEKLQQVGLKTTFVMADMATEAERVAQTMEAAAVATTNAARANREMRAMRGMGGMGAGGAGGGGGHREGFLGRAFNASIGAMIGFDIAREGLGPGLEYVFEQSKFRTSGLTSPQQQAQAKQMAEQIANKHGISTPADVLKDMWHLFGVSKSLPLAMQQTEMMTKGQAVIASLGNQFPNLKGQDRDLAQNIMRAAEMSGQAAFSPNDTKGVAKFKNFFDTAVRGLAAEGGNVTVDQLKQTLVTMRSARLGADIPAMMADLLFFGSEAGGKGGRTGTVGAMLSTFSQHFRLGNMNKAEVGHMLQLGLLKDPQGVLRQSGKGHSYQDNLKTLMSHPENAITDFDGLLADSGMWLMKTFKPAVIAQSLKSGKLKSHNMPDAMKEVESMDDPAKLKLFAPWVQGMPKTQTDAVLQYMFREQGIMENRKRLNEMPSMDKMFDSAMQELPMKLNKVNEEFSTLAQLIGDRLAPALTKIIGGLDLVLGGLNRFISGFNSDYPNLTKGLKFLGDVANTTAEGWEKLFKLLEISIGSSLRMMEWAMGGFKGPMPQAEWTIDTPDSPAQTFPRQGSFGKSIGGGLGLARKGGFIPPPPPYAPVIYGGGAAGGAISPGAMSQMSPDIGGNGNQHAERAADHLQHAASELRQWSAHNRSSNKFNPLKAWEKSAIIDGAVGTGGGGHYAQSHFTEPTTGSH